MTVVLSTQNRFRVAAEVDAAAVAVSAAVLVGTPRDIASARSRLQRAERAATASEADNSTELPPGQPILWINTFAANSGEPIGILEGRIVAETVPLSLLTGRLERRYLAMIEAPWGGEAEHLIREEDVIAVPDHPPRLETQAGHTKGTNIADLIATAFTDTGPVPGTADTGRPPPQAGPNPDYGLDL
ncbi:hypothetical protein [Nocardia sp. alder85J]|uniref:hypothetical protein n=1 Tax=Nocardia sp. alder85J TaxID=2862949 RepID=UPI001CD63693|nr:hypothetical protein [Nocardia sp. alder85J]MCX4098424.1 hypothetical protein [Nocardia sp. alder85J]